MKCWLVKALLTHHACCTCKDYEFSSSLQLFRVLRYQPGISMTDLCHISGSSVLSVMFAGETLAEADMSGYRSHTVI